MPLWNHLRHFWQLAQDAPDAVWPLVGGALSRIPHFRELPGDLLSPTPHRVHPSQGSPHLLVQKRLGSPGMK